MKTTTRFVGGAAVVSPTGLLANFQESTVDLRRELQELVQAGHFRLVVDLSEARLAGVQCLGLLIAARVHCTKGNGELKLCRLTEENRRLIEATKLNLVFEVYETEDEAVASFERTPVPGESP